MSTAPPAEDASALAVLSGAIRRANASAVAMSHWSASALIGSPRSRSASTGRLPSSSGPSANSSRRRVESSSSSQRLGRSRSVTPCRPSGGTMWLPGGRWPPSITSRMCGVAARSSAPKRGRSLRSGGSRLPRSSSEVDTIRMGPTASASRVLCACGSHLTQSQCVRFCSELSTATISWSGFWKAVAEQIIARAVERTSSASPHSSMRSKARRSIDAGRLGWIRCTTSSRCSADAAAGSTWSTGALSGGTSSSDRGCEHRP